jgi:hypothetical protein
MNLLDKLQELRTWISRYQSSSATSDLENIRLLLWDCQRLLLGATGTGISTLIRLQNVSILETTTETTLNLQELELDLDALFPFVSIPTTTEAAAQFLEALCQGHFVEIYAKYKVVLAYSLVSCRNLMMDGFGC